MSDDLILHCRSANREHVVKRRTTVRVCQSGEDALDGLFCLAVESPELGRAETLFDLLNSSRKMVPFVRSGDRRVSLLTRMNIDWVIAPEAVTAEWIYPPHYRLGFEEPVHVFFLDGRTIEGRLQIAADPRIDRASDFLNGASDFFPVKTRLGTLFANKARVRETLLVESVESDERGAIPRATGELPRQRT
jgi:hypothetical protein